MFERPSTPNVHLIGWLTANGRFAADLDLNSIQVEGLTSRQLVVAFQRVVTGVAAVVVGVWGG